MIGNDRFQDMSLPDLVNIISTHHPDHGGDHFAAIAEIKVRSILMQQKSAEVQEKATRSLIKSTWALVAATVALVIVAWFR